MPKVKRLTDRTWGKTVDGVCFTINEAGEPTAKRADVQVRLTVDSFGTSLSLQAGNEMILIPLESVADMIAPMKKKGD